MKSRKILVLVACIAITACSGQKISGLHINEVTKYHHQIAIDGKVIEGFVYGKANIEEGNAIVVGLGRSYRCSDGSEKFVLEEKMTILLPPSVTMLSVDRISEASKIEIERLGFIRNRNELKSRLPMLFDSTGCTVSL